MVTLVCHPHFPYDTAVQLGYSIVDFTPDRVRRVWMQDWILLHQLWHSHCDETQDWTYAEAQDPGNEGWFDSFLTLISA
ncbi:hypothetical protein XELAEV_18014809mg [Xenopus laevis]|uniref:Uncharacterized protein n=1 Tax=Xenopus laevis TaxID=8355 RepID=A0A974HVC2_XENLA|nr:hypothetical protein XELAEV_18014809mg [Xenopus laevis]